MPSKQLMSDALTPAKKLIPPGVFDADMKIMISGTIDRNEFARKGTRAAREALVTDELHRAARNEVPAITRELEEMFGVDSE